MATAMGVGAATTGAASSRVNQVLGNILTQTATGVGSSTSWQLRNLRCGVLRLLSTGATVNGTGQMWRTQGNGIMPPPLVSSPKAGEWTVLRTWATLAFSAVPSADCDYGFEMMFPANGTAQSIILNNVPGFGFVRRANGNVAVVFNDGVNPISYTDIPGIVATSLNVYEIRITGATRTQDASLMLLVNGTIVYASAWAAGGLPTYQATYPNLLMAIINFCGAGGLLDLYEFRGAQAPTMLETF